MMFEVYNPKTKKTELPHPPSSPQSVPGWFRRTQAELACDLLTTASGAAAGRWPFQEDAEGPRCPWPPPLPHNCQRVRGLAGDSAAQKLSSLGRAGQFCLGWSCAICRQLQGHPAQQDGVPQRHLAARWVLSQHSLGCCGLFGVRPALCAAINNA